MRQYEDPPRLADEGASASPKVRRAVMAGRTDLPDDAQIAQLARQLQALVPTAGLVQPSGLEVASSASGTAMGSSVGGLAAAKIKLATLLVAAGVGGAGAWHVLKGPGSNAGEPAATPIAAPAETVQQLDARAYDMPARQGAAPEQDAVEVQPVKPRASFVSEPAHNPPGSSKRSAMRVERKHGSASEELRLLDSAHRVIIQSPRQALKLAKLHEKRFAQGVFRQERDVIVIEALLRLGRYREAKSHAERFFERFPDSSHLPRVRALLKRDAR